MHKVQQVFNNTVHGGTIISMDTETIPKLTGGQKNPDQGRITKVMAGANVMVFQNKMTNAYENMVKRRLQLEGKATDFVVGPRQWGTRIPNSPFIANGEEMYLEVIFLRSGTISYKRDGQPCDIKSIQGLAEKEEGNQGGLENKVIIRTFKFDSIKRVVVNGVAHIV